MTHDATGRCVADPCHPDTSLGGTPRVMRRLVPLGSPHVHFGSPFSTFASGPSLPSSTDESVVAPPTSIPTTSDASADR